MSFLYAAPWRTKSTRSISNPHFYVGYQVRRYWGRQVNKSQMYITGENWPEWNDKRTATNPNHNQGSIFIFFPSFLLIFNYYFACMRTIIIEVNKQDFLQVFQGSGIGKMGHTNTNERPWAIFLDSSLLIIINNDFSLVIFLYVNVDLSWTLSPLSRLFRFQE